MKFIRLFLTLLTVCFLASSCLEYQFTTRIHPDGSCERILTVRGDSSDLMDGIIPIPNDSAWKIKIARMAGGDKKFELTATARFAKVEDMNRYFVQSADSMPTVSIYSGLKKQFRWFYTYLSYKETYQAFTPYKKVPIENYLKEEEIRILFAGDEKLIYLPDQNLIRLRKDSLEKQVLSHADSLKMEEKKADIENRYEAWLSKSIFEEAYAVMVDRAVKMNDPRLSREVMLAKKDSILNDIKEESDKDVKGGDVYSKSFAREIVERAGKYFPHELLIKSEALDSAAYSLIDNRFAKMESVTSNSYGSQVIMPGLVTSTNAKSMNGNLLSWQIEPGEFYFRDYVLFAESRVTNSWAFWLTGILIVLLTVLLIGGAARKAKG